MIKTSVALSLGQRVRKLRKERRLSQEDLAEKIEMSTDTISNIERAVTSTTIETLEKIAGVFKLEICELFHFQNPPLTDRKKIAIFDEIFELLKNEHPDILSFTVVQAKFIISMKESFINRLRK
jgi:transcriptional regulator with XRE-family HTH domain